MSWRESLVPAAMQRIAVLSAEETLRDVLVAIADAGVVQPDLVVNRSVAKSMPASSALERLRADLRHPSVVHPALRRSAPDLGRLEREGILVELAGEAELEVTRTGLTRRGPVSAFAGWCPAEEVEPLTKRLASLGGAVIPLAMPQGAVPPTLIHADRPTRGFQPLIDTYGTVPYRDLNPALFAGLSYVVMFGMMFGDVGHGLILISAAVALRSDRLEKLRRFRPAIPFLIGAGLASTLFGFAYGEFFGPTTVTQPLWMQPLEHPVTLLIVGIAVGSFLLAVAQCIGVVNRCREAGAVSAMFAVTGVAGAAIYLGIAVLFSGMYFHEPPLLIGGAILAGTGLVLAFIGSLARSSGGGTGALQATVETFDATVRLGSNTVSFSRLAAFGLTHAALGQVIWSGTTALWAKGGIILVLAAMLFVVGNAAAFALESLVAAIQALRLEYYELFSRMFADEGTPFKPWHIPISTEKEVTCSPG